MKDASFEGLCEVIDRMTQEIRSLETLGQDITSWDQRLIHDMVECLDETIAYEWEMKRKVDALPTFTELIDFLERQARGLVHRHQASTSSQNPSTPHSGRQSHSIRAEQSQQGSSTSKGSSTARRPSAPAGPLKCPLCRGPHGLYHCGDFLSLSIRGRWERVKGWKLCPNCLRSEHPIKECSFGVCKRCNGEQKHNSILCSNSPAIAAKATAEPGVGPTDEDGAVGGAK
jgi:hypothetical protein